MPRPSLKTVRTQEILEAFAACVARYGLEGATQERIAEQAGVKRSILRHYLGNRDAMIDALIDHVVAGFDVEVEALVAALPARDRVPVLLDLLFDPQYATDQNTVLLIQALATASERHPKARRALLAWTARFLTALEDELRRAHPRAPKAALSEVAMGVMGIYFSTDSLVPLRPPEDWQSLSRRAAERLIATLED